MGGKYGVRQIIAIIGLCITFVQKDFQSGNSMKQLLTKYEISRNCPKLHSHIHKNCNFLNIIRKRLVSTHATLAMAHVNSVS